MPQRGHMRSIRDEAGALPRDTMHEAGARSQRRVHTPGTHSPETTTGAGIASIPAPVTLARSNLRRRPFP